MPVAPPGKNELWRGLLTRGAWSFRSPAGRKPRALGVSALPAPGRNARRPPMVLEPRLLDDRELARPAAAHARVEDAPPIPLFGGVPNLSGRAGRVCFGSKPWRGKSGGDNAFTRRLVD